MNFQDISSVGIIIISIAFLVLPKTTTCQMLKDVHPCDRPCDPHTQVKVCEYSFAISYTRTMNPSVCGKCPDVKEDCYKTGCAVADGHLRPVYLTNNLFPGPEIRVCEEDIVIVNVTNQLLSGESLTIHWHGIHQERTPYMDGVPMVSQCGIDPGTTFEYIFQAKPSGTHFWHAHASLIRDQGVAGGLIVRPKNFQTSGPKYEFFENDRNPSVLVQDWSPTFYPPYFVREESPYLSIVVNGRQGGIDNRMSPPSFFVYNPRGQKPFLRIISNGFLFCPLSLTVEGHRITLVRGDGHSFEPATVDKMYVYPSERYDVFMEPLESADIQSVMFTRTSKVFKMEWTGSGVCIKNKTVSMAVSYLIYTFKDPESVSTREALNLIATKATFDSPRRIELDNYKIFNPIHNHSTCENKTCVGLTELRAFPSEYQNKSLTGNAVEKIYLFVDSSNALPNINNISFKHPTFPLLTQFDQIPKREFCNLESNPECSHEKVCHCLNIYQVRLNSIVELILADEGHNGRRDTHTFHLHGYSFAILAQAKLGSMLRIEDVKNLDKMNHLKRNFDNPVYKDTVSVPEGGYAIIRFKADNPGFWILHCHLGLHLLGGMAVMFKVGEYEDMILPPPTFPRCGSWYPDHETFLNKF